MPDKHIIKVRVGFVDENKNVDGNTSISPDAINLSAALKELQHELIKLGRPMRVKSVELHVELEETTTPGAELHLPTLGVLEVKSHLMRIRTL